MYIPTIVIGFVLGIVFTIASLLVIAKAKKNKKK